MINLSELLAILPGLAVLVAVKSILVITILLIAVAVWPFVPRPRFRRRLDEMGTLGRDWAGRHRADWLLAGAYADAAR